MNICLNGCKYQSEPLALGSCFKETTKPHNEEHLNIYSRLRGYNSCQNAFQCACLMNITADNNNNLPLYRVRQANFIFYMGILI
jgi:hypothetical protein